MQMLPFSDHVSGLLDAGKKLGAESFVAKPAATADGMTTAAALLVSSTINGIA
jgi:hypothetical protein